MTFELVDKKDCNHISECSRQWASRPDDQRFTTIEDLAAAVHQRKDESWTTSPRPQQLRTVVDADSGAITLQVEQPKTGDVKSLEPTHYAFGQLCSYAKAPADYLRRLDPTLAAINLQWGLEHSPIRDNATVLAHSNGSELMRAITSTSYGRIWDADVVRAVMLANERSGGRWKIPAASYQDRDPKRATTLYASDRDVFIFLVDDDHRIDVGGRSLARGFYVSNSEVGAGSFVLCTFLYDYVCDNRNIWGAAEVKELRMRHSAGAPERFAHEARYYLQRYAEQSTQKVVDAVKAAQSHDIPVGKDETVEKWLQARGFTKSEATAGVEFAKAEEGQARSVWDIMSGLTASARAIPHNDKRVDLEVRAGKLLKYAGVDVR
jgi:hypothetical protein